MVWLDRLPPEWLLNRGDHTVFDTEVLAVF